MQKIIESPKRMFIIILLAGILGIIAGECYGQTPNYVKLKSIEPAPGSGYAIGTGTSGSPVYTQSLSITTLSATNGYFLGSINTQTNNASYTSASSGMIGSLNSGTITSGSFIKTSGTSSQFLKADGSSDGTAYLSTATASTNYVPYSGANSNLQMGSQFIGLGVSPTYPLHVVNTATPQARFAYDATNMFDINVPSNGNAILALKPSAQFVFSNNINLTGFNIVTGSASASVGMIIGTGTTQRIAFFGSSPVTQRSATSDLGDVLSQLGLRASGTAYPITTSGVTAFTNASNTFRHITGNTAVASSTLGAGAGTAPTSTLTGCTDLAGKIQVTTGTSPGSAGALITVTFGAAYSVSPNVILTPANAAAAALSGNNQVYPTGNTGTFVITTGPIALAASTVYQWYYQIIQ